MKFLHGQSIGQSEKKITMPSPGSGDIRAMCKSSGAKQFAKWFTYTYKRVNKFKNTYLPSRSSTIYSIRDTVYKVWKLSVRLARNIFVPPS